MGIGVVCTVLVEIAGSSSLHIQQVLEANQHTPHIEVNGGPFRSLTQMADRGTTSVTVGVSDVPVIHINEDWPKT